MATVSVIIPNYNHAPYLPRRIESVLGQTYRDFELVILDDCSPDQSRAVIGGYRSDPRVSTVFNDTNSGNTFRQWQKGLDATSGKYVWIAESDDESAPEFLTTMVDLLDAYPNAGMAACESLIVDSEGVPQYRFLEQMARSGQIDFDIAPFYETFVMNGRDYCRTYMVPWNTLPNAGAILFRRSALLAAGGPDLTMRLCGDWLTYCRVLTGSDIARAPAAMNYFRQHSNNVRTRTKAADFVAQALRVQHYVADALATDLSSTLSRVRAQYAQAILSAYRGSAGAKVPPGSIAAALRAAAGFGPAMFVEVASILARESAIGLAKALGVRRSRPA